ncbi:hypothetical protein LIER_38419 [Lithospermum erythrorhizon]|uniref:Uncharacterized protein n=1 Tax=Lithospermum erythrorhizon TaxID=34254 RepID=A0AAV3Q1G8_LITER
MEGGAPSYQRSKCQPRLNEKLLNLVIDIKEQGEAGEYRFALSTNTLTRTAMLTMHISSRISFPFSYTSFAYSQCRFGWKQIDSEHMKTSIL